MQLRYKPTKEIHTFNYAIDIRMAMDTGQYEYIDGKPPIAVIQKQEETEETELEKPVPRIRRRGKPPEVEIEEEVRSNED
jgi:hypothetical protein